MDWREYVLGPDHKLVAPVAVTLLSGDVTNLPALTGAGGAATFTVEEGGEPASVLIDYGKEIAGTPFLDFAEGDDSAAPDIYTAFSETRDNFYGQALSKTSAPASSGDSVIEVTGPALFRVGDTIHFYPAGGQNVVTAIDGDVLTLENPLAADLGTGVYVVALTSRLSGDSTTSAGYPRVLRMAVSSGARAFGSFEGGQRYQVIELQDPGSVSITGVGTRFEAYRATAAKYEGYFLSSSRKLNKIWYSGAYTLQTSMQPAGKGAHPETVPVVLDGAKRDRALWAGDLAIEGPGILATLGSNGQEYVRQTLLKFLRTTSAGAGINGQNARSGAMEPYSNSYSHWAAIAAVDYVKRSGDMRFARRFLPVLQGQLAFDQTLTRKNGLVATSDDSWDVAGGYDWNPYDGAKSGVVTSFNLLYFEALRQTAYLEQRLGDVAAAEAHLATASKVKRSINRSLFNTSTGVYDNSASDRGTVAQDANSLAVLFGVVPPTKLAGVLASLKGLWGPYGSAPYSDAAHSTLISPFISAFTSAALFEQGDVAAAKDLVKRTWGPMTEARNPSYTGTFWENVASDGTVADASTSLSHGWSAGATAVLSDYVLGVKAIEPGYRTFEVDPAFETVQWARGAVPTPRGAITVRWQAVGAGHELRVRVPAHSTARVRTDGRRWVTVKGGPAGVSRVFVIN
ncbi:alpha-L-rhamnosidase C-terminal domain-containing protein [Nocardioides bruguierae]|uniref:Alpha-L-rhamnosidase n=1 Tax=Nocardioides bruguierae TaxID=2945102 RepID=A0A9X2IFJ4_9ACTN|nr:alpha-L-rhamnosidase C-terminal domain-containing protein [Nocardioides bruguierae]MCL8026913.1 hypothetical protein [Nocardioides bruguierae]MCM0621382.1 hypothetical protein [Nocardioides bruguierae]